MSWQDAFRALKIRDFRIYWLGQWVSVTGTWMQTVAQGWLVYRLTDSPFALGLLSAARFGPSLLGSPLAGVLVDRLPRRRVVIGTQSLALVQAAALAVLTLSEAIQVWQVLTLALLQGVVDTVDMPARHSMQVDLVGLEDLQSAVSLNSSAFNAARLVGPALAGLVVAAVGEGWCFALNAFSYVAVLGSLAAVRPRSEEVFRGKSFAADLFEGLSHCWREPRVRAVLAAVAVTSGLGLSYATLLPVFARDILSAGAEGYGFLLGGAGAGAMVGALLAAARAELRGAGRAVALSQAALGMGLLALGLSRTLWLSVVWMVVVGLAVAIQLATTNVFLQTTAPVRLRGRVLAAYIWIFSGVAPLGGLGAGWMAEHLGAPTTAVASGLGCVLAAAVLGWVVPRLRRPVPAVAMTTRCDEGTFAPPGGGAV